jgi:hypothetical protein
MRKFPLFFLLAGLLLAASSAGAETGAWRTKPEWFACQKDAQCVLTCGCAPVAVNKEYAESMKAVEICTAAIPCKPEDTAQCVDHKCQITHPDQQK